MPRFLSMAGGVVLVIAALTALAGIGVALDARQPAPRFYAKTLDGERLTNESLKGKVVLLQFWTTWCQYCRSDQDSLAAAAQEFKDKGLVVVGVDVGESRKKVKQYLEQSPRAGKIVLTEDTNLAALFAAKGFPLYILLDRDGKIAGKQEGASTLR